MPYNRELDPLKTENARMASSARNWYTLVASDLGAKELPRGYGRALRVRLGSGSTPPLTMVVVPVEEQTDATTRTIIVDTTEYIPFAVRRIVSLNGAVSIPAGVTIEVITA